MLSPRHAFTYPAAKTPVVGVMAAARAPRGVVVELGTLVIQPRGL